VTASPPSSGTVRALAVAGMVAVLVAFPVAVRFGPRHTALVAGPVGAGLLLALARSVGLGADDVGLGRRSWRRGAAYAAVATVAVAATYAVAVLVSATRAAFLDERYRLDVATAAVTALVLVPVGTVVFEEVAFRGVLWGLVRSRLKRGTGAVWATAVSSALFGLWHVLPSLRLHEVNPAVADLVGSGPGAQALAVAGAVGFTGAAGVLLCELRRRSGSLLAPFGVHWAVNGLGVLVSAGVTR
jgi:uncharacterized protein